MEILQAKVEETYRHKKTGEIFKERKDWEAKVISRRDGTRCKVIMPPLDLVGKTK